MEVEVQYVRNDIVFYFDNGVLPAIKSMMRWRRSLFSHQSLKGNQSSLNAPFKIVSINIVSRPVRLKMVTVNQTPCK